MTWVKRALPYLIGAAVTFAVLHFINKKPGEVIKDVKSVQQEAVEKVAKELPPQIEITEETSPEKIYCPKPQTIVKWKTKWKEKPVVAWKERIVYRDRIVHVPVKIDPGCYADWENGTFAASTDRDRNLKCVFDHRTKTIKTRFSYRGSLRTNPNIYRP